jgi:8-oxo-dGTP pyrophosphatase MutT (NUDIX family)
MKQLKVIGTRDESLSYEDRPTVKVVIRRGDEFLVLNKGLLPGGGIEPGEKSEQAIERELREELGASVKNIQKIGEVVQYRDFIQKKYSIYGYEAEFDGFVSAPAPKDAGEVQFELHWMTKEAAIAYVTESIITVESVVMLGDAIQGRLYNLMTSRELLKAMTE